MQPIALKYMPTNKNKSDQNVRLTFWRTLRNSDEEIALNGERYTKSDTIDYAQGCSRMVSQ